jgi:hypothetical protein
LIHITDIIHSAGAPTAIILKQVVPGFLDLVWISADEDADVSGGGESC